MPNPLRDADAPRAPDDARRLFLCAAATLAVHQAQEALVAPPSARQPSQPSSRDWSP